MTETEKAIATFLLTIISLALLSSMTSCSLIMRTPDRQSLITGKNYKITKRDIKRSMSYSTWEYQSPKTNIMIPRSQSIMVIETSNK